jgi:beta-ribofuranosylaminobenzene 5'-phosphate synthase
MTHLFSFPRLHASLFDLGNATPRQYGGVGFAIDGIPTVISTHIEKRFSLHGTDLLDAVGVEHVRAAIERLHSEIDVPPMSIRIESVPRQHVGLGSKTSLVLGVIAAILTEAGIQLERTDIKRLSGRGGTSGIGVQTFFEGGLVVDAGHRVHGPRSYGPSSAAAPLDSVPPAIINVPMPREWSATLLLPDGVRRSGLEEQSLFAESTPIPNEEVFASISYGIFGLATAAMTCDFEGFVHTLRQLQHVGFKAREIASQAENVVHVMNELRQLPMCGVGMSSMGRLVPPVGARFRS